MANLGTGCSPGGPFVGGAPTRVMVKAYVFAFVWHVVIFLLPRSPDYPWVAVMLALLATLFPIIVAVNFGFQARRQEEQSRKQSPSKTGEELVTERAEPAQGE